MKEKETSKRLLQMLLEQNGNALSGEKAASDLNISRVSVWKAIQKLKKEGYDIKSSTNKGYTLNPSSDILNETEIENNLSDFAKKLCSGKIKIFKTIDSTNNEAKRFLNTPADAKKFNASFFFAEHQSAGRGRFFRTFYSPKEAGLYFSLIICPEIILQSAKKMPNISCFTAISAVAVCRSLRVLGFNPKIKWVNDIYLDEKKVCGILSEAIINMESSSAQAVIIGIGINVKETNLPPELKNKAGFLYKKDAVSIKRNIIAAFVISNLIEMLYGFYPQNELMAEYKDLSFIIGKKIQVLPFYGKSYTATAVDISPSGSLIIKTANGEKQELVSGEVSIILNEP